MSKDKTAKRRDFLKHLQNAKNIVREWPNWKKGCLTGSSKMFKIGDKVEILNGDSNALLKHRKNHNGIVTHINGSYILVRPMWCKWELEAYPNELFKI